MTPDRQFAIEVVQKLRTAGYEALFAGGCVRDQLLGVEPKDYDVATNALPEQVRSLFGYKRTLAIGASFGVITVLGPRGTSPVEVATFRSDGNYSDGRRPDAVEFTTAEADAQRRDLTINGVFFDPLTEQVIDYVGGQADLERRVIRAIGDPAARFAEDKLRMLRAVRFAATMEFELAAETLSAIEQHASEIATVSAERIGVELRRMLVDPRRSRALALLESSQLAAVVLPEYARLSPPDRSEVRRIVGQLATPPAALVLAALLRPALEPQQSSAVATRLRWPREEGEQLAWLLRASPILTEAPTRPWPQVQRLLVHPWAPLAIALHEATCGSDNPAAQFCRKKLSLSEEELNPPLLVAGDELVAAGIRPGPKFGQLLAAIRDAQLVGTLNSSAEALEFARHFQ